MTRPRTCLLGLTLLLASPGHAQEGTSPAAAPAAEIPRLTLEQAIVMAANNNPNITAAQVQVVAAEIRARRAALNRFGVSVDLTAEMSASSTRAIGLPSDTSAQTATRLSQVGPEGGVTATAFVPLYDGGKTRATIDQAEILVEVTEVSKVQVARALEQAVFQAYWNIKGIELQIAATTEALELTREALLIIQAKAEAGLIAPLDVNRSRVDVISQESQLLALRSELYQSQQLLLRLLHLPGTQIILMDEIKPEQFTPAGIDRLMEQARSQRPELQQLQLEAGQAEVDVRLARSVYYPQIALKGTANLSGDTWRYGSDLTSVADYYNGLEEDDGFGTLAVGAGVGLSWNLFNLGLTRDSVQLAELGKERIAAQTAAEEAIIRQQVATDLYTLETLQARATLVNQRVELARDNLQIVQALYAQGSASLLDLFEAQNSFRDATSGKASFDVSLVLAEYQLRWTVGERLNPETP